MRVHERPADAPPGRRGSAPPCSCRCARGRRSSRTGRGSKPPPQHEPGWKRHVAVGARDAHPARPPWAGAGFAAPPALNSGSSSRNNTPVVGKRNPPPGRGGLPPPTRAGHAGGMVRVAESAACPPAPAPCPPPATEWTSAVCMASSPSRGGSIEGRRRREHGLARTGRPRHEHAMLARRRYLQGALGAFVPGHVGGSRDTSAHLGERRARAGSNAPDRMRPKVRSTVLLHPFHGHVVAARNRTRTRTPAGRAASA